MTKITSLGRRTRFIPSSGQTRNHWRRAQVRGLRLEPLEQRTLLDALGPLGSNLPPVASDDGYAAFEGTELRIPAAEGVLVNDTDPDGDPLSAVLDIGPEHGTLVLDPDGSLAYTPDADFTGQDSFTYRASDGELESDPATVTIDVVVPAEIRGMVWEDGNGDGLRDPDEPPLQSWVVYADYDGNAQHDTPEPSAVSGPDGAYALTVLPGTYPMALVDQLRWTEATPRTVSPAPGEIVEGIDFGNQTNVQRTGLLPVGGEFRVNTETGSYQSNPAVAIDASGDFLVAWESYGQDGDGRGVFAQRFDANGVPQGSELQVNTHTHDWQVGAAVAMDPSGNFVVAWQSNHQDGDEYGIFAQRYDSSGMPHGEEFRVNVIPKYSQSNPAVAVNGSGDFTIVWESEHRGGVYGPGVYTQRYDANGVPQGSQSWVDSETYQFEAAPAVAMNEAGEMVIAWEGREPDGSSYGIYAQRYDTAGAPQGDVFRVNTHTFGRKESPTVAMGAAGDFVIAWQTWQYGGASSDIWAQRYDAQGVRQGAEFQVNWPAGYWEYDPIIAMDDEGSFAIAWASTDPDGSGSGVYLQRYDAAGVPQGDPLRVNTFTSGDQRSCSIAMGGPESLVVAWESYAQDGDGFGIYARRYALAPASAWMAGYVWDDLNGDGVQGPEEPGRGGIRLTLSTASEAIAAETVTGPDGRYQLDGVASDESYVLDIHVPEDWGLSPEDQGSDDTIDSDVPASTRRLEVVLSSGQNPSIDVGLLVPTAISGTVYADIDGNGNRDRGEQGLPGWVVFADADGDGQPDAEEPSTVTQPDGSYVLRVLAGTYAITAEDQIRWVEAAPQPMEVEFGGEFVGVDFGNRSEVAQTAALPVDSEFRVDTYASSSKYTPAVGINASGAHVVAWHATSQDGDGHGVYAQRFDATGAPQGDEFRVNTHTAGNQQSAAVAVDGDGNFVIAWQSDGQDGDGLGIFAQRYDASGVPQGNEFQVNTHTAGDQRNPAVGMDADGSFLVAWDSEDQDGDAWGIYAQRFDGAGMAVGDEFRVNSYVVSGQVRPAVAMDPAGNCVIAWESLGEDGDGLGIYAQRYDSAGAALDSEFHVSTHTTNHQGRAATDMDSAGNFVIAWQSSGQDGSGEGIYAQRYDAAGGRVGGEFRVNTFTEGWQAYPAIAMDAAGGFLITWQSSDQDGSSEGVYAQRYDAAGARVGGEFRVNSLIEGSQLNPDAAMDAAGNAIVVWRSYEQYEQLGIRAQRYAVVPDPAHVTGRVWEDEDGNGFQDAEEPGREGVIVTVSTEQGSLVATAVTDGDGRYWFGPLPSEVPMTMEFAAPFDRLFTLADQGSDDAIDSDVLPTTGSTELDLAPGQSVSIDAGVVVPVTVSGTVYADYAANGVLDPGDVRLPGWTAFADYDGDGQLGAGEHSAATDANGTYVLSALPGDYAVCLVDQALWFERAPRPVALLPGESVSSVDFANHPDTQAIQPAGFEFRVNTDATGGGAYTVMAADALGKFVVAWEGPWNQDGDGYGIFARRFDAAGVPQGDDFLVNTFTAGNQRYPAVAMDSSGNFVIAWQTVEQSGSYEDIHAQRYDAAGVPLGEEFLVNTVTAGDQTNAAVAMSASGSFVIAWEVDESSSPTVFVRRFDAAGVPQGDEFPVYVGGSAMQRDPAVAMDASGNFVVAWDGYQYVSPQGIFGVYAQRYDAAGVPRDGAFRASTEVDTSGTLDRRPSVAMDAEGRFVVAFAGYRRYREYEVLARSYDADGAPLGDEFRVNAEISATAPDTAVALDPAGNFLVTWNTRARCYNGAAFPHSTDIQINSRATHTAVAAQADGAFVAAFAVDGEIRARRYALAPDPGTMAGRVWEDLDGDGLQDPGEPGRSGVSVGLWTPSIVMVASDVTDSEGRYRLFGVPSGELLELQVEAPPECWFSPVDQGSDDALDSDVLPMTGSTEIVLAPGENPAVDAGLLSAATVSGRVWLDADSSGTPDPWDPGLPGWLVFADQDGDGQLDDGEAWASTEPDGSYRLGDLYPGEYAICLIDQPGWPRADPQEVSVGFSDDVQGIDFIRLTDVPQRQAVEAGEEIVVNTHPYRIQDYPAIAMDAGNNFVVAWTSEEQDGSGRGVFARRYDAAGTPQGDEFQVNTYTQYTQWMPAVAMNPAGNFVIAWDGRGATDDDGIYAQRYDAAGLPLGGELPVNTHTLDDQERAKVAMDAAGNFVVVWQSDNQDGDGRGVFAQRFDAAGVPQGEEFQVNTHTTGWQDGQSVAMDAAGNFVVVWDGEGPTDDEGIYAQRYDAAGMPLGSEFRVNTYTLGSQMQPVVAADPSGNVIVAWRCRGRYGVYAQRYDAAGRPVGGEFQVRSVDASNLAIASDPWGNFVIAWGWQGYVRGQCYSSFGVPQGPVFRVSDSYRAAHPAVAIGANGTLIVARDDDWDHDVYAQRLELLAEPAWFGGHLWEDLDGDGVQDPDEPGRGGVDVTVWTPGGEELGTVETSADGRFWLDRLPSGTPLELEVAPPSGFVFSMPGQGSDASLDSDIRSGSQRTPLILAPGENADVDGGLVRPAAIAGTVYSDCDGDGLRDRGEPGLPGWTAYADFNSNGRWDEGEPFVPSDANGLYELTVAPGTYPVALVEQQQWIEGPPRVVALGPASELMAPDVGNRTAAPGVSLLPVGGEWQVNTYTAGYQSEVAVAMDAAGAFVVVWRGEGPTDDYGVYAQRYDAAGVPVGDEFRVNTYAESYQSDPAVAMDASGGFVIAWTSKYQDGSGYGVFAQRYDSAGTPLGEEFQVNTYTGADQNQPAVAMEASGNFVIAWYSFVQDLESSEIHAQRFDAAGVPQGAEFRVNRDTDGSQSDPSVAMDAGGNFVVTWRGDDVRARRFDAAAVPLGDEFRLNAAMSGGQSSPDVAMNDGGNFAVAWYNGDGHDVRAQRFDAHGAALRGEIRVNASKSTYAYFPAVAMDAAGNLVVVWDEDLDGSSRGVFLQVYNAVGVPQGGQILVNTHTTDRQERAAVALNDSGDVVVAWTSDKQDGDRDGVFAQRFALATEAASVSGRVWEDLDGDGVRDAGEVGVAGRTVFFDLNENGELDPDEPWTATLDDDTGTGEDEAGTYGFDAVGAGTYSIVTVSAPGWEQTFPTQPDSHVLVLEAGQSAEAVDFGGQFHAPPASLDVDGNGDADALTDGIVILRYLFGFTGDAMVQDSLGPNATRTDPADIEAYLANCRDAMLDVDASGAADALTDGILILRYLFGFAGDALVEEALAPDATRADATEIASFLDSVNPDVQAPSPTSPLASVDKAAHLATSPAADADRVDAVWNEFSQDEPDDNWLAADRARRALVFRALACDAIQSREKVNRHKPSSVDEVDLRMLQRE